MLFWGGGDGTVRPLYVPYPAVVRTRGISYFTFTSLILLLSSCNRLCSISGNRSPFGPLLPILPRPIIFRKMQMHLRTLKF